MAADQPKGGLLPLCDGPDESEAAQELRQQENSIVKELSRANQSAKQFSERASEEPEKRDVLSKELSEAVQHRWLTEGTIYATLQKAKSEVHHFEHEADIQKRPAPRPSRPDVTWRKAYPNSIPKPRLTRRPRASKPLKELNKPKQKTLCH